MSGFCRCSTVFQVAVNGMCGTCGGIMAASTAAPPVVRNGYEVAAPTMPEARASFNLPTAADDDGYSELRRVLDLAVAQAARGKGRERHAVHGERFEDQQIVQLAVWMGSTHGDIFQACKKAMESTRLKPVAAKAELLGAINYLAAAVIVLERLEQAHEPARAEQAAISRDEVREGMARIVDGLEGHNAAPAKE